MQNSYELYIFHFLLLALKRIHLFDILLDGVFCLKTGGRKEVYMTILIKNGRVINPSEKMGKVLDVYVKDGVIVEKGENIEKEADKVIDAKGCFVMPGLIDLHVHFRDPGLTYKEDIIRNIRDDFSDLLEQVIEPIKIQLTQIKCRIRKF